MREIVRFPRVVAFCVILATIGSSAGLAWSQRVLHAEFGKSKCNYCGMLFAEKMFGGEIQTDKSSVLIFDATESLIAYLLSRKPDTLNVDSM